MNNELKQFATLLIGAGFKVYAPETERPTWFYFVEGNSIGYAQRSYFGGIDISTVHKPCREYGTGFSVVSGASSPTVQDAVRVRYIPSECGYVPDSIKRYRSWEEFVELNSWIKYTEVKQ